MITKKQASLGLLASLGLNVFLAGMITSVARHERGGHAGPKGDHHPPHRAKAHEEEGELERHRAPGAARKMKGPPGRESDQRPPWRGAPGAQERGAQERGRGGPPELMMLRAMASEMGGREDPRVKKLWEGERDQIADVRQAGAKVRRRIDAAFVKEPFSKAELLAALEELNEVTGKARSRAQKSTAELASQMTPEERKRFAKRVREMKRARQGEAPHPGSRP